MQIDYICQISKHEQNTSIHVGFTRSLYDLLIIKQTSFKALHFSKIEATVDAMQNFI